MKKLLFIILFIVSTSVSSLTFVKMGVVVTCGTIMRVVALGDDNNVYTKSFEDLEKEEKKFIIEGVRQGAIDVINTTSEKNCI